MIRVLLLVLIAALSTSSLAFADCTAGFEHEFGRKEVSLSVPAKLVKKFVKVPIVGQIIGLFKVELTFWQTWHVPEAVCRCNPCCEAPRFQYLGVTIEASAWDITWSDVLVATRPGEPPPVDPNRFCAVGTSSRTYQAGTKVEFEVDLSVSVKNLPVVEFEVQKTQLAIKEVVSCRCTDNPECEGNAPPLVHPFGPIMLKYGEEAEFHVWAFDPGPRPNLSHFGPETIREGCLTAYLKEQDIPEGGRYGSATYGVSYTGEEEIIKSCVDVVVKDKCGDLGGYRADVHILYPPTITLEPGWYSRWYDGEYRTFFEIYDPNFRGCSCGRSCQVTPL